MLETERLRIVEATEQDIDTIIAIESHKDNRNFLWIGTPEEHKAEIADPKQILFVFKKKEGGSIVGYALVRLDKKSDIFELRRVAVSEKNAGFGKEAMKELFRYAFEDLDSNRFWLDAFTDNVIGIKLYEGLGMHKDGVLRQSDKSEERGYLDQIIYSMLKTEYNHYKQQGLL